MSSEAERVLPYKTFAFNPDIDASAVRRDIELYNASKTGEAQLTSEEFAHLEGMFVYLQDPANAPQPRTATIPMNKILERWPETEHHPVWQILSAVAYHSIGKNSFLSALKTIDAFTEAASASAPAEDVRAKERNATLCAQSLANAFGNAKGTQAAKDCVNELAQTFGGVLECGRAEQGLRLATGGIVLNYSILMLKNDTLNGVSSPVIQLIEKLLADEDFEVVYRALLALGNILGAGKLGTEDREKALEKATEASETAQSDPRVKRIMQELATIANS